MNTLNKCLKQIEQWQSCGYSSFKLWKEAGQWSCKINGEVK